jgi:hypothetical protein
MPTVAATKLIYEVKRKLNRLDSDKIQAVEIEDICSALTEAELFIFKDRARKAEVDSRYRKEINQFELKERRLTIKNFDDKLTKAELPADYYKILNTKVKASKRGCSSKIIPVIIFQSNDLNRGRQDPYWKSSFEWEHAIGDEAEGCMFVYQDCAFVVDEVIVDYIKYPPEIHAPSMTTKGSYVDWNGKLQTQDQGWVWEATADIGVNLAVYLLSRDLGDSQDMALQMNNIINTENFSKI